MKYKVGDVVKAQQWVIDNHPHYKDRVGKIIAIEYGDYKVEGFGGVWTDKGIELAGGDSDLF